MPDENLGDRKWRQIFQQQRILDTVSRDGRAYVTAELINQTTGIALTEARRLCKVDCRAQLPIVMKENGLAILATTNGKYCIGQFDPFVDIPDQPFGQATEKELPAWCTTLDAGAITGECKALDAAFQSGMLQDLCGEEVHLTIRGREYSNRLTLPLPSGPLDVESVQLEVDGGFEGLSGVHLFEAKMCVLGDVSIRQVLYPWLHWESVLSAAHSNKVVQSYVLFYDQPWFKFFRLLHQNGQVMVQRDGERVFTLRQRTLFHLAAALAYQGPSLTVPGVAFPQADNFDRVLTMLTLIGSSEGSTRWELFNEFGITMRQIDYYAATLRWMGLCGDTGPRGNSRVTLTEKGRQVFSMPRMARLQELARIVFSDPLARASLQGENIRQSASWDNQPVFYSAAVRDRRAHTIERWVQYFRELEDAQQ